MKPIFQFFNFYQFFKKNYVGEFFFLAKRLEDYFIIPFIKMFFVYFSDTRIYNTNTGWEPQNLFLIVLLDLFSWIFRWNLLHNNFYLVKFDSCEWEPLILWYSVLVLFFMVVGYHKNWKTFKKLKSGNVKICRKLETNHLYSILRSFWQSNHFCSIFVWFQHFDHFVEFWRYFGNLFFDILAIGGRVLLNVNWSIHL